MIYFDTSYIVRLYLEDPGWEKVRKLAATGQIACAIHGRAETVAAFHRKSREGAINRSELKALLQQFEIDCQAGAFEWLSLSPAVIDRAITVYAALPNSIHFRGADALHLSCAAENGHREVYSNDAKLLAGARHFGLKGINIL